MKTPLSKREFNKIKRNPHTIDLRTNREKRVEAMQNKKYFLRNLKIIVIWAIILTLLGWFQVKTYWEIETTPKQEIDPLEQIISTNTEIQDIILDNEAPILTTKEYLDKADKIYTKEYRQQLQGLNIYMTSYNAEEWQTDSTPCIAWWTGVNVCEAEKEWRRIIALSQELTSWSTIWKVRKKLNCGFNCITYEAGEKVSLEQTMESIKKQGYNPRCNWEFEVSDAMNVRYRKRWDLFFSNRKQNTSCNVKIFKI